MYINSFSKKNLLGLTVTNKKFRRISDLFLKIKLIRGQTVFGSKEENVNIFWYKRANRADEKLWKIFDLSKCKITKRKNQLYTVLVHVLIIMHFSSEIGKNIYLDKYDNVEKMLSTN